MTPLSGIKIVSFNHFLMGPLALQMLGDLGADVIAIEPPGGAFQRHWGGEDGKRSDGETMLFLAANRNKRSLALNLKDPVGVTIARKLIATADVVSENYRPGVMDKLGLGYDLLKADNPRLIYASASGYGADGPYVNRPGQDLLVQAMSGLAAVTGTVADGARPVGVSAVDHHGAALLAFSIVTALFNRERTGEGVRIDVNLLASAISLQTESFTCFFNGAKPDTAKATSKVSGFKFPAPYGVYATSDGEVALSLGTLKNLGEALGSEEIAAIPDDKAFTDRKHVSELIAACLKTRSTDEWEPIFAERQIWYARVNDYDDVINDPQVKHNEAFLKRTGERGTLLTLVNHPVRYNGEAPGVRLMPQPLGAQSRDILTELGYDRGKIDDFVRRGIVAEAHKQNGAIQ